MTTTSPHSLIWHDSAPNRTGERQYADVDGYRIAISLTENVAVRVTVYRLSEQGSLITDGSETVVAGVSAALALIARARRFETATRHAS